MGRGCGSAISKSSPSASNLKPSSSYSPFLIARSNSVIFWKVDINNGPSRRLFAYVSVPRRSPDGGAGDVERELQRDFDLDEGLADAEREGSGLGGEKSDGRSKSGGVPNNEACDGVRKAE